MLWLAGGLVCVAIGGVGVVVPGLPTTVFFILAAACFTRSSPRLEAWVLGLPRIGTAVADYRAGRGMPARAKVLAVASITGFSTLAVVLLDATWPRAAVVVAAVVGAAVVLRTPTRR